MGTNFYWADAEESDDIQVHIGKRSGAGLYCWDCGTTLHMNGTMGVHLVSDMWFTACPGCGAERTTEPVVGSAMGAELGLNAPPKENTGVRGCSSFTWTLLKHKRRIRMLAGRLDDRKLIVDEYGKLYTPGEFLRDALSSVAFESQYPGRFS